MKRLLKWLIPCLVACFMVVGLVQTASFTFANEEVQTEEIDGLNTDLGDENYPISDDENTTGDSDETGNDEDLDKNQDENKNGDNESSDDEINTDISDTKEPMKSSTLYLDNPSSSFTPEHNKKIKYLGDDLYNLTLDVEGKYSSTSEPQPVDILLILDNSGSMGNNEKMKTLKNVLTNNQNGLSTVLSKNQNVDVNIAAVSYSGVSDYYWFLGYHRYPDAKPYDDASQVIGWTSLTSNKGAIDSAINEIQVLEGTNPQAGFYLGKELLKTSRQEALKYVIFLTDGYAGYYYDTNGYTNGSGNGNNTTAFNNAINESTSITGLQGFYTIAFGAGADNTLCTNLINSSTASKKKTFAAKDSNGIQEAFDDIAASITETTMTNVTITDTLSKYVELVTPVNDIKVIATNNETKEKSEVSDTTITVNGKTITATFAQNSRLEEGYTYSISYDVRVTDEAYKDYISKGGYTATGDANTDARDNNTSSGKAGFYSNDSATVTYTYNNQNGSATYAKPVVQINTVDIPVTKNWIDADGKSLDSVDLDKINLSLTTKLDNKEYTVKETEVKKSDSWTGTFKTVPMNPAGTFPVYSITDQVEGFIVSDSSVSKNENGYSATITNKMNPTLTITKNVTGAFGDKTASFDIEVFLYDKNNEPIEKIGTEKLKDGKVTVKLKDGESETFTLPFGTKYKVEETSESSTGYSVSYTVDSEDETFSGFVELNNNDEVVVTNHRDAAPITGIIDNTPKGLGLIGSIVVEIAAIAFVLKKKRQLKM